VNTELNPGFGVLRFGLRSLLWSGRSYLDYPSLVMMSCFRRTIWDEVETRRVSRQEMRELVSPVASLIA
jgi:hypothetical protein